MPLFFCSLPTAYCLLNDASLDEVGVQMALNAEGGNFPQFETWQKEI